MYQDKLIISTTKYRLEPDHEGSYKFGKRVGLYPNDSRSALISIKNENGMIISNFQKELPGYSIEMDEKWSRIHIVTISYTLLNGPQ